MQLFKNRRQQLSQQLLPNSVVIIPGARLLIRNGDTDYLFRQNSNFYYLTGFSEPDAFAVLTLDENKNCEYSLFVPPNDPQKEIWNGKRAGVDGAINDFGADYAYPCEEFAQKLAEIINNKSAIYYPFAAYHWFTETVINKIMALIGHGKNVSNSVACFDINYYLHEMRLLKEPEEILLMQRAADISVQAHLHAMQLCRPGMHEYELAAEFLYMFTKNGGNGPAYSTIVAAGSNACTLHYTENQAVMRAGDLVLIDAGAEYQNYASDVSRTFPINGKFTGEQREIYEIVLTAKQEAIAALRPGVSVRITQEIAARVITEGLVNLGLLSGSIDGLLEQKAYLPFYMHSCSHWLGLDTHDAGAYKQGEDWRPLLENMVLTVEPGIYIRNDLPVDARWHNIGVRIEDDIAITAQGSKVLSAGAPKLIDEIESIMQ